MVAAPPQAPEVALQAPEFGPFEFCIWRQLCPFPEVHCWPQAPPPAPRCPQFGYWLRPLKATMPFPWSPPKAPEVGPEAPEFGPFEFCVCMQLCPIPEVNCWPPAPVFRSTLPKRQFFHVSRHFVSCSLCHV